MASPKKGLMLRRKMRGFTLIEMMIVVAIILIASGMFFMTLQPAMRQARLNNAYNTTLAAFRSAREKSIAERRVYIVTLTAPRTMTLTQGSTGIVTNTYTLPLDVAFSAEPGIPNSVAATPDRFGTGGLAIDFDQGVALGTKNMIYFQADGSAQDVNSNLNNGVLYMARPGDLFSSRAITVWGATGRLRGWRLYANGAGATTWRKQ